MKLFKKIVFLILLFISVSEAHAQGYRNEWIDYNKTYYRFPVAVNGVYRVSKAVLTSIGLGNVPVEQFQLFRNGKQIALHSTAASGILPTNGYIEFFGFRNDAQADLELYAKPSDNLLPYNSLHSDTAYHYLTIGDPAKSIRYRSVTSNAANSQLKPDEYVKYEAELIQVLGLATSHAGYARNVDGFPIRSSAYEIGTGYRANTAFSFGTPRTHTYPGLFLHSNLTARFGVQGGSPNTRTVRLLLNDSIVKEKEINSFDVYVDSFFVAGRNLFDGENNARLRYTVTGDIKDDNNFILTSLIRYNRLMNLGNTSLNYFSLDANTKGNHLRFGNANLRSAVPLFYDLTNNVRYVGEMKGTDSAICILEPSDKPREIVFHTSNTSVVRSLAATAFTKFNFKNYGNVSEQGDYIIITNSKLKNAGDDYIEKYRAYRASAEGGGFNAKIYDIDELASDFAYGIRKSPLAVKNFINYALDSFKVKPKFVFIIGKGLESTAYRGVAGTANGEYLNLVQTFGTPASDNYLVSRSSTDPIPQIPVGRISVINNDEIKGYYDKVIDYERFSNKPAPLPSDLLWRKNVIHLVGESGDAYMSNFYTTLMNRYRNFIVDSLVGASVLTQTRYNNPNLDAVFKETSAKIDSGAGLITFFGHRVDINTLPNPSFSNYTRGKYPVIIANGCESGYFGNSIRRLETIEANIPERFTLAKNAGSIAFISNMSYGIINYLNLFTTEWYKAQSKVAYGKTIGEVQQLALKNTLAYTGTSDYFNKQNVEQFLIHGDPAIKLFADGKPDYAVETSGIVFPGNTDSVSIAHDSVLVKAYIANIGRYTNDTLNISVYKKNPFDVNKKVFGTKIVALKNLDSISFKVPVMGSMDLGINSIEVVIEENTKERTALNNKAIKQFVVYEDEINPVYPVQYAIVNSNNLVLKASTANPVSYKTNYAIQIDTTNLFNSPGLHRATVASVGGVLTYKPALNFEQNKVYYWRVSPERNNEGYRFRYSSFLVKNDIVNGSGQSHYYQYLKSGFNKMDLDVNHKFLFGDDIKNVYVVNAVYNYGTSQANDLSVSINGKSEMISACVGRSIIFNVFDEVSLEPWDNSEGGLYGSATNCNKDNSNTKFNFEFSYVGPANRKKIMDFINVIPKGKIVFVRSVIDPDKLVDNVPQFDSLLISSWKKDTLLYGKDQSLYHSFKKLGLDNIDSLYKARPFIGFFAKDDQVNYPPEFVVGHTIYDIIQMNASLKSKAKSGSITSDKFGPARNWHTIQLDFKDKERLNDFDYQLTVIGIDNKGKETTLKNFTSFNDTYSINDIDAAQFPFVKLKMDQVNNTSSSGLPLQLDYWRVLYDGVAEGALSAVDSFNYSNSIVLHKGLDSLKVDLAFKNISKVDLNKTNTKISIYDLKLNKISLPDVEVKFLKEGDVDIIKARAGTIELEGDYYLAIEVNKNLPEPENTYKNNFVYIPFNVSNTLSSRNITLRLTRAGESNQLSWIFNSSEADITYVLESSGDGVNFDKVYGVGNSSANLLLNYIDQKDYANDIYYRVKVILKNGDIIFSNVVTASARSKFKIYPNPATDYLYITLYNESEFNRDYKIVDLSGRLLQAGQLTNLYNKINVSKLPKGVYTIVLSKNELHQAFRFLKN
ncbi:putative type IX secretion system sortase PorU2 [Polluticaenibacter yanchengensis]|uniref:C25 family cysteine peptidase n=1 Tax=Polluticaenibacter yanchengensis TaxID=3014562 RepID=A0ABT4UL94_9BACT|nr:C25 family cysteine peptidase [Chitinophagaceae bacterium LY-5]